MVSTRRAGWCGRCGKRFIIMRGKGNGGVYFYYVCRDRQGDGCSQPYLRVEAVETAVERHYLTVRVTEEFRSRVRAELDEAMLGNLGGLDSLKKRLGVRLLELSAKEDQYLELIGDPGWPKAKIRHKLNQIQAERDEIAAQLADTTKRLAVGREFFLAALALLRDPQDFYRRGGTSLKKAMNKIVFTKLYLDGELISDQVLGEAVAGLVEAQRIVSQRTATPTARAGHGASNASSPVPEDEAAWMELTEADLLDLALAGQGSSRAAMVGDTGIEPVTSSVSTESKALSDRARFA